MIEEIKLTGWLRLTQIRLRKFVFARNRQLKNSKILYKSEDCKVSQLEYIGKELLEIELAKDKKYYCVLSKNRIKEGRKGTYYYSKAKDLLRLIFGEYALNCFARGEKVYISRLIKYLSSGKSLYNEDGKPLEVHHTDYNFLNNKSENLEIIKKDVHENLHKVSEILGMKPLIIEKQIISDLGEEKTSSYECTLNLASPCINSLQDGTYSKLFFINENGNLLLKKNHHVKEKKKVKISYSWEDFFENKNILSQDKDKARNILNKRMELKNKRLEKISPFNGNSLIAIIEELELIQNLVVEFKKTDYGRKGIFLTPRYDLKIAEFLGLNPSTYIRAKIRKEVGNYLRSRNYISEHPLIWVQEQLTHACCWKGTFEIVELEKLDKIKLPK